MGEVVDDIPLGRVLPLREWGRNEYWLQEYIWQNPSSLGLGELSGIGREVIMQGGGKLDLLLRDSDDEAMYEVEVMLGATDESHIIRTIEYWDSARRKWPQRQHYAVVVAESITRRFFNVMYIFGQSVPLIAIQANIIEANGFRCLHFTQILGIYQESSEIDVDPPATRADWEKKAPASLEAAEALLKLVGAACSISNLTYRQGSISLQKDNRRYFWFYKRANKAKLLFRVNEDAKEKATALLEQAGLSPEANPRRISVTIDKEAIEARADAFRAIAELVLAYHD